MSQQPVYAPAPAGWYPRPGDPQGHLRRWDGRQWCCEISGPMRQEFDHLRSIPPEALTPPHLDRLRQLTAEVSAVEDLVLRDPSAAPPLVEVAPVVAAPYPPAYPTAAPSWASSPYGSAGVAPTPRRSAGGGGKLALKIGGGLLSLVIGVIVIFGKYLLGYVVTDTVTSNALHVDGCITLSYPVGAKTEDELDYAKAECTTGRDGKLSYVITAKLTGKADCGASEDSFYTYYGSAKSVDHTYCLMPNLVAGECLRWDSHDFLFDVACTDPQAGVKVTTAVDQGTGVTCAAEEQMLSYPNRNRTYCLGAV